MAGSQREVVEALDASVTNAPPPVSFQMSQLSSVPTSASPASTFSRAPGTFCSSHSIFVSAASGLTGNPTSGLSSRQRWYVRRSCQTSALWSGWPVALSQTRVVARCPVTPIAASSLASVPARAIVSDTRPRVTAQISSGSCSSRPGAGVICVNSR